MISKNHSHCSSPIGHLEHLRTYCNQNSITECTEPGRPGRPGRPERPGHRGHSCAEGTSITNHAAWDARRDGEMVPMVLRKSLPVGPIDLRFDFWLDNWYQVTNQILVTKQQIAGHPWHLQRISHEAIPMFTHVADQWNMDHFWANPFHNLTGLV